MDIAKAMKILIVLFFFLAQFSYAQGIKGLITDPQGKPVPYATLYVKEVSMGTTSNSEGNFEVHLDPGSYTIQFRSMGFSPVEINVELSGEMVQRNIILNEQVIQLREVRVFAGGENPAYPIMRRAISMAPYYRNKVKRNHDDVYLKGTAKLEKVPKLLQKTLKIDLNGRNFKEGDVFVGENFSQVEFEVPNVYKQKIISSNMSMIDNATQTFDLGLITTSIYEPELDYIVMPFSPQVFSHYRFNYEGAYTEGNYLVNKIRIIPKRKSKQLLSGYLYIIDGLWCLQRLELENDQNFGHIKTRIEYAELRDKVWLPVSHSIFIDGKMMGIRAKANYTSSVKYRMVTLNEALPKPALIEKFVEEQIEEEEFKQKLSSRQKKIDELLQKEDLSNRETIQLARLMEKEALSAEKACKEGHSYEIKSTYELERDDSATLRNEAYWESLRPNPLTIEEQKSFELAGNASTTVQDGRKKESEFNPLKLLGKNRYSFRNDSIRLTYSGLIGSRLLTFNPVEGFRYRQEAGLWIRLPKEKLFLSDFWVGYSFGPERLEWAYSGAWGYNPAKLGVLRWSAGQNTSDYLGPDGVSPLINTFASLFFKANFSRYQYQQYFTVSNQFELANGLLLRTGFEFYARKNPEVSTQFSFFRIDQNYIPNHIFDFQGAGLTPTDNRSAIIAMALAYTPQRYYRMIRGRKIPMHSAWPTFTLSYRKGLSSVLGSSSDWDYIEFKAEKRQKTGAYSELYYHTRTGFFLNNQSVSFADYASFFTAGGHVKFNPQPNNFRLLPSYSYHSKTRFAEAHLTYATPYLVVKYLPLVSEKMWRENLHFNFLSVPGFPAFIELGYSISELFGVAEVGVFSGFDKGRYTQTAIRFTARF